MTVKTKTRLGRGLEALFSGQMSSSSEEEERGNTINKVLPIACLHSGSFQPRKNFDNASLQELSRSIATHGLMQPIIVRSSRKGGGLYEIIAGERRWRAAKIASLETIAVQIVSVPDDKALAWGLIENLQREDLNPIEKAEAMARFIRDFHLTHEQIASTLGCSRTAVTNLLRLLQLSKGVCNLIHTGKLDMGHARCLLSVPENIQMECALYITEKALSVRETERYINELIANRHNNTNSSRIKGSSSPFSTRESLNLQEKLSDQWGINVKLRLKKGGGGMLLIGFEDPEELSGVLERMGVNALSL